MEGHIMSSLQVFKNGSDISNVIISYERSINLCSGIGILVITAEAVTNEVFGLWDEIILYEDSNKVGVYNVSSVEESLDKAYIIVNCQDNSKRLSDSFIDENIDIGGNTSAKYWMEYLLDIAGVSYTFSDAGTGGVLNPGTILGLDSVYNLMIPLLQQSGWYFYFNQNGVCIIGKLFIDLEDVDFVIQDNHILSVKADKNDKMLRNRVVVWGLQDVATSQWVFADVRTHTPWDYDANDLRTVLYANTAIPNTGTAYNIASKILNEFAKITYTHTIQMPGFYDLNLGDTVYMNSDLDTHTGIITSIMTSVSAGGFITTIILDERCPRLFSYIGNDSEYVYISTLGAGVKRKLLDGTTWVDYSAGLLNFNVTDLMIKRNIFSCVAQDGYGYIRTPVTTNWSRYMHPTLTDLDGNAFTPDQVEAVACDINSVNYNILFGYRTKQMINGQYRGWVVEITPNRNLVSTKQLYITDVTKQDLKLIDNEFLGDKTLAVAEGPIKYLLDTNPELFWGIRDTRQMKLPDDAKTYGPLPSETEYSDAFTSHVAGDTRLWNMYIRGQDVYGIGHEHPFFVSIDYFQEDTAHRIETYTNWPNPAEDLYTNSNVRFWIDTDKSIDNKDKDYDVIIESRRDSGNLSDTYFTHYKVGKLISEGTGQYPYQHYPVMYATTQNITVSGLIPVDGVPIGYNQRILVKDQTDKKQNGLYLAKPGIWARTDTDTMKKYSFIRVESGTENAHTNYQLDFDGETLELGVTDLTFKEVLHVIEQKAFNEKVATPYTDFDVGFWGGQLREFEAVNECIYWYLNLHVAPQTSGSGGSYLSIVYSYDLKTGLFTTNVLTSESWDHYHVPYSWSTLVLRSGIGLGIAEILDGVLIPDPIFGGGRGKMLLKMYNLEKGSLTTQKTLELDSQSSSELVGYGPTRQSVIIPTGSNKAGDYIESYVKFRVTVGSSEFVKACQEVCPGVPFWRTKEKQIYGAVRFPDFAEFSMAGEERGTVEIFATCCVPFNYDSFNYTEYNFNYANNNPFYVEGANKPLVTSNGNPIFLHNRREIYSAKSLSKIGELQTDVFSNGMGVMDETDDYDGGIYINDEGGHKLIKEGSKGGVLATATGSGWWGDFSHFTNGFLITNDRPEGYGVGWERIMKAIKMKNSVVLSGLRLTYLLDAVPSGGFVIKDYDFYNFKLEESYDYPLSSYTVPSSVYTYMYSGIIYSGTTMPEHFRIYDPGFGVTQFNTPVNDVTITTFVNVSGQDYGKYLIRTPRTSGVDLFGMVNVEPAGELVVITGISGVLGQVESTNFKDPNYIFVNTLAGSGGIQEFYQRQGLSGVFLNASINLPTEVITSIRTDDSI